MNDLPDLMVELRQLQPLYALLSPHPALRAELEQCWGLERVAPNDARRLSTEQVVGMNECLLAHGLPHVPAELASRVDDNAGEGLLYFARSCASLREALAELLWRQSGWLPWAVLSLSEEGGELYLRMRPRAAAPPLGLLMYCEGTWAWMLGLLRVCLPAESVALDAAVMTPDSPCPGQLAALMGLPVRFGAPCFEMRLRPELLDVPLPGANPALRQTLSVCFDLLELYLPSPSRMRLRAQVRICLRQAAHGADLGLEPVAQQLGRSPASLRRQLQAEGCSFSAMLQAHRQSLAFEGVVEQGQSPELMASQLGYAGAPALTRAARKWWGAGPQQLREDFLRLQALGGLSDWACPLRLPSLIPAEQGPDMAALVYAFGTACLKGLAAPAEQAATQGLAQDLRAARTWLRRARHEPWPVGPATEPVHMADPQAWAALGARLLWRLAGRDYAAWLERQPAASWPQLLERERAQFGLSRVDAAALLLARWGLPGAQLEAFRAQQIRAAGPLSS
ncbi:MAG: AraC family transcriptional regulator ligand-binding domain-containing protein [Roseateles sp.]